MESLQLVAGSNQATLKLVIRMKGSYVLSLSLYICILVSGADINRCCLFSNHKITNLQS